MEVEPNTGRHTSLTLAGEIMRHHLVNAIVAFIFATTGPVAIMLAVGAKAGLGSAEISTWLFGAFFINGVVSVVTCLVFRQPLIFLWTIPGIVLVGTAVDHLSVPEIVGAYILTGAGLLIVGVSGLLTRIMNAIPLPIVMGMVAGVLLQFGLDWIAALSAAPLIAGSMTAAYFGSASLPALGRVLPPMIAALVTGITVILLIHQGPAPDFSTFELATPTTFAPVFSLSAAIELVVPLMITVIFAQNGQGIVLLRNAGHAPPVDKITSICGITSIVSAFTGAVSTCLTGPVNGILSSSGRREHQYIGGVIMALMCVVFGLAAPAIAALMIAAPKAFIATLGGLALLNVLQGAFTSSFSGPFAKSALITFMVTLSGVEIANIGSAFWGLVAGMLGVWTLERGTKATDA